MSEPNFERDRFSYGVIIVFLIFFGLFSRSGHFPEGVIKTYSGDTIWAMMTYGIFAFLKTKSSASKIFFASLSFCFFIEFSQLYHSPTIDLIRKNNFAALILGRGFLWSDLACYFLGICLAFSFEHFLPTKITGKKKAKPSH
jgi:hypothetical protein